MCGAPMERVLGVGVASELHSRGYREPVFRHSNHRPRHAGGLRREPPLGLASISVPLEGCHTSGRVTVQRAGFIVSQCGVGGGGGPGVHRLSYGALSDQVSEPLLGVVIVWCSRERLSPPGADVVFLGGEGARCERLWPAASPPSSLVSEF